MIKNGRSIRRYRSHVSIIQNLNQVFENKISQEELSEVYVVQGFGRVETEAEKCPTEFDLFKR